MIRLVTYLVLWEAITRYQPSLFGYSKDWLLTYILGTSIIRTLVINSMSYQISGEIATGELSNYLLKPISYLKWWAIRDVAEKLQTIGFSILEVGVMVWLFQPPIVWPASWLSIAALSIGLCLAVVLQFYLTLLISLTTFWYPEHNGWPQKFIFDILVEFLAGALFPLSLLPGPIYAFILYLPTTYLLFFPMLIWLEPFQLGTILTGILIMLLWILILQLIARKLWLRGIKTYEAVGR